MLAALRIKGKLVVAFLVVGLVPLLVVGAFALWNAGTALEDAAVNKLAAIRDIRKTQVEQFFAERRGDLGVLANATNALLDKATLKLAAIQTLKAERIEGHLDKLRANLAVFARHDDLIGFHLRLRGLGGAAGGAAGKASPAYRKLHAEYDPGISDLARVFGFEEAYLIDNDHGRVLYSTGEGRELGSSLSQEKSPLADLWRGVTASRSAAIVDFTPYESYGGVPYAFMGVPILAGSGEIAGVAAVRIGADFLNALVQERAGLPKGGESYLVGTWKGLSTYRSDRTVRAGRIGQPRTDSDIEAAYAGRSRTHIKIGITGEADLMAFAPIRHEGLQWALVTAVPLEEILSPPTNNDGGTFFAAYAKTYGHHDLFLIHPEGQVFYTVAREADYRSNILNGEFKDTNLGQLVLRVLETRSFALADFRPYPPTNNEPAAFVAAPVLDEAGNVRLVVAIQFSAQAINTVMQRRESMGESGESFLVGQDLLMRSDSFLDPEARSVRASFATPWKGQVDTPAVRQALAGETGARLFSDYRGVPVVVAFTPVQIGDFTWAVIAKMDAGEAFHAVGTLRWVLGGVAGLAALLTILAGYLFGQSLAGPVAEMTTALGRLSEGALDTEVPGRGRADEIGAMARAADVFKETAQRNWNMHWVKSHATDLAKRMQQAETLASFCDTVTGTLTPLVGGGYGVLFVAEDNGALLLRFGAYGVVDSAALPERLELGEGLVGQCARDHIPIIWSDLPTDYLRIASGLGEAPPAMVIAYPILLNQRLLGVIEIASFRDLSGLQQTLLDEVAPIIALSLDNLKRGIRTHDLLEYTQRQAEELRASEEELKVQQEELQAANEELTEKSRALEQQASELRASEEELKAQQEELRATNEELTEKAVALESQKEALSLARREADARTRDVATASRYKSEFLANMSHELRTPLNSLLILAQDLADDSKGNLDGEQLESARIIHESGRNLLELINEILDLSKIEAGKMEIVPEETLTRGMLDSVRRGFARMAEEKGLAFDLQVEDGVPESIVTDPKRVGQILANLVGNALKFTETGTVTVRLWRPPPPEGMEPPFAAAFSVIDTGIGIPPDRRERIFAAFEQVDGSISRKYGGTGLGLAISRSLADLLGGRITLDSHEGEGSTFTLFLPPLAAADAPAPAPVPPPARPSPAAPVPALEAAPPSVPFIADDRDALTDGDPFILVIEDDPKFAAILVEIAHRKGFKCIATPDGETGVRLAKERRPTGIVLDVGLPGMDGWQVMDRLKEGHDTRHIPVHFISAFDSGRQGLARGAVGYLTKPVTREQISGAFERLQHFAVGAVRKVLVVEDDPASRTAIARLIRDTGADIVTVSTGTEFLERLRQEAFDCVILDLGLPDISGFDVLEKAAADERIVLPPVVIYSGRDLSEDENTHLRAFTDSIVIKGAHSPERLLDEVTLFLHSVHTNLPAEQRRMLQEAHEQEAGFSGKTILVVDDDMRNIFALSKALRSKGFKVLLAQDAPHALAALAENKDVDMVLMDIMMPDVDGLTTIRRIRAEARFAKLPIIAVTAKAMPRDRQQCLEAGANDYVTKPIDMDKLLSAVRLWLR